MHRIYKVCGFIFLFFTLSVNAAERHTEAAGGFSYEVTANWRVIEYPGLKFKVIITDPIGDFSPNMTLVDESYDGTLAAYEKASIPHMKQAIPGFKILQQTKGKTSSGLAYRAMMYEHKTQNGIIIQIANFLELKPGHKLVMTCTSPKGHEDRINHQCNKIVHSLKVE